MFAVSLIVAIVSLGLAARHHHQVPMLGEPTHGRPFTMYMKPDDHLGSAAKCLAKVHKRGGGVCRVIPGTLTPGKTTELRQVYADTWIALRE